MVYMDDITIFSNSGRDHTKHLEHVFLKCRKFGISLNPKKSNFDMKEGKILGHIISKDGINIDLDRVKEILKVDMERNKKEIKSFIGKINFLRLFIPNFAKIINQTIGMLMKD